MFAASAVHKPLRRAWFNLVASTILVLPCWSVSLPVYQLPSLLRLQKRTQPSRSVLLSATKKAVRAPLDLLPAIFLNATRALLARITAVLPCWLIPSLTTRTPASVYLSIGLFCPRYKALQSSLPRDPLGSVGGQSLFLRKPPMRGEALQRKPRSVQICWKCPSAGSAAEQLHQLWLFPDLRGNPADSRTLQKESCDFIRDQREKFDSLLSFSRWCPVI